MWRQNQHGLPWLSRHIKRREGLNPKDRMKDPDTDKEVLRQFLRGAPKCLTAICALRKVLFEGPEDWRKALLIFQYPR